jgi:hypothetical protein
MFQNVAKQFRHFHKSHNFHKVFFIVHKMLKASITNNIAPMSCTKVPMTYNTIWTYNKFHQSYNSHEP